MNMPFVSIIIPCRNEGKYIGKCLETVSGQDYPKENLEVLVVDGMSEDGTKVIVGQYSQKLPFIKLLENQKKFTNFAFNIGIKESKGEIVMIMGAHTGYEKDYISKCVKYLKEYDADNAGGVIKTMPSSQTLMGEAIAFCLSSIFGAMSFFRIGSRKIREVDTVFGGCYKREVFDKIGYFNENLLRSQDMEFNLRLKKAGGKILLIPDIIAYYYPSATLKEFVRHNFNDGVWVTYPLKFGIRIFKLRHLLPLFFVLGFLALAVLGLFFFWVRIIFDIFFGGYFAAILFFSFKIAIKHGFKYFFIMPVVFFVRHFFYGLGSLFGLLKILK